MFTTDLPIKTIEEDVLKRTAFSKKLAKAILSYFQEDSFVISLCGKWGSGKTSILNLVTEEIEKETEEISKDEKPIIVKFNPWNYTDSSQLISQFFTEIIESLKIKDSSESLKNVGEAIKGYSSLFEYTKYIPVVGSFIAPLSSTISYVGESISEKGKNKESLNQKKKAVTEALIKQKHKFIIIIDDIDRMNNQQIKALFQLVNSVAGFPNMIYLLAFDREVVARALKEEQNCDGEEYLEKIVQVPFDIPEANKDLIIEYFVKRFVVLVGDNTIEKLEKNHWHQVFGRCVVPYLNSIRDAKRILNSFEFSFNIMKDETNSADLLALTALHIYAPEIFNWIYCNKEILVGGQESFGSISGKERENNVSKYLDMFKTINPQSAERMMNIVQALFPKFEWKTSGFSRNNCTEKDLRKRNSVASSEKFNRYFDLSLETIPITQEDIKNSLMTYNQAQLEAYLETLLRGQKLDYYFGELLSHLEEIPQDRIELFIYVLTVLQENPEMRKKCKNYSFNFSYRCNILADLFRMNKGDNAKIIMEMIHQANKSGLNVLADIVETLMNAWDEKNPFTPNDYCFVSKEDLDQIEKAFSDKIEMTVDNIFSEEFDSKLYNLWGEINEEKRDEHVRKLMEDSINIPRMLKEYAHTWSSSNGTSGWSFNENNFKKYISAQEAYEGTISLKNNRFSELTDSEKQIAIAYVMWYELGKSESEEMEDKINKNAVEKLKKEWERKTVVNLEN